jgi:hypothetical protein
LSEIEDLDALKPPERKIKIGGKVIDVSNIPFDVSLDVIRNLPTLIKMGKMVKAGEFDDNVKEVNGKSMEDCLKLLLDVVKKVLKNANSEIDDNWIEKNISFSQMVRLTQIIMEPVISSLGTGEDQKKTEQKKSS